MNYYNATHDLYLMVIGYVYVSFVLAYCISIIIDFLHYHYCCYKEEKSNSIDYYFTLEELYPGCLVYDVINCEAGVFCGKHDDTHGVVMFADEDNKLSWYYPLLDTIHVIEEQE